jgi:hypothetical protein
MFSAKGFRPGLAGRKVLASFVASLAFTLVAATAEAGTSRGFEHGGQFRRFDPVVADYNRSGAPFRIVGLCQSACTLFLSIRNVCVEPQATFQFHAGNDGKGKISDGATNHLLKHYNPKLRRFVVENGYLETFQFHTISGRDIIEKFGYPACAPLGASDNESSAEQKSGGEGSYLGTR